MLKQEGRIQSNAAFLFYVMNQFTFLGSSFFPPSFSGT